MIRHELFEEGKLISAEIIDLEEGTFSYEKDGIVEETRLLTAEELKLYTDVPISIDELKLEHEALKASLIKANVITELEINDEKI